MLEPFLSRDKTNRKSVSDIRFWLLLDFDPEHNMFRIGYVAGSGVRSEPESGADRVPESGTYLVRNRSCFGSDFSKPPKQMSETYFRNRFWGLREHRSECYFKARSLKRQQVFRKSASDKSFGLLPKSDPKHNQFWIGFVSDFVIRIRFCFGSDARIRNRFCPGRDWAQIRKTCPKQVSETGLGA